MGRNIYIGDIPMREVKNLRQVLRELFTNPKVEGTFWEKCRVGLMITWCRFVAWRAGKDMQDTLKAMAMAVDQVNREEKENDF